MVTVTDNAKEELKRIIETRSLSPGKFLRLAMPPVWKGEGGFGIVIDDKGVDDYVFFYQGMSVLLMDAGMADGLTTAVLDFKESPAGMAFTLDVY
ncbi:MAG: hypothetical protein OYI31_05260 [Chloroflexota bacterium]|nr:hypothetical protein [Chloroflexota bacterium]MDE3267848.1 hypothetical protein [Chloroflexota bacterium]